VTTTVIVPSWNGAARLARLLPTLVGGERVIVVDNGSTDGTGELLTTQFPDVDVLSLPTNEGFSRAVNKAARVATGDAIVLVNDDCVCEPSFASSLAASLDPGRSVVMAAGILLEETGLVDSAGIEVDDTLLVFDYLNGEPVEALATANVPFGPSAAAAAFDREAFLALGGFDEKLFAYWEDLDLVVRLRLAGGTCALASGARAIHAHSSTLGSGSARKNYLTGFGRGYVLHKWGVLHGRKGFAAIGRELAICAAQLAVDHTVTGFTGRIAGWRAIAGSDIQGYPVALGVGGRRRLATELRRRWRRRRRLKEEVRAA
jgi:GT2 family glycosyltransferase